MRTAIANNQKVLERIAQKLYAQKAMSCIYTEGVAEDFARHLPEARKEYLEIMAQIAALKEEMGVEPKDDPKILDHFL